MKRTECKPGAKFMPRIYEQEHDKSEPAPDRGPDGGECKVWRDKRHFFVCFPGIDRCQPLLDIRHSLCKTRFPTADSGIVGNAIFRQFCIVNDILDCFGVVMFERLDNIGDLRVEFFAHYAKQAAQTEMTNLPNQVLHIAGLAVSMLEEAFAQRAFAGRQ